MTTDIQPQPQPSTGAGGWFKRNTNTIVIVVVGLILALAFLKKPNEESQAAPPVGDFSGVATDAYGRPIIYRDVASTFINVHKTIEGSYNVVAPNPTQPVASAPSPPDTESPQEYPVEPYFGLLGARIEFATDYKTYRDPATGQWKSVPVPGGSQIIAGKQGRVWYVDPSTNIQHLLTAGEGPGITNEGFPQGSPQNTPGAYGGTPILAGRW